MEQKKSNGLLVVFSHGKESGPWGSKIQALADIAKEMSAEVISLNYRQGAEGQLLDHDAAGEPERRVQQLLGSELPAHETLVLVGSSMGGYVSAVASEQLWPAGLFLLAPAFYLPGYAQQHPVPCAARTLLVHGWRDEVVPAAHSVAFACQHRAALHLLDGDHRLNSALPAIEPLFRQFLDDVLADKGLSESVA